MKFDFNVANNWKVNSKGEYCVYVHKRKDNNKPFYIGCGISSIRPFVRHNRSKKWYDIVNTVGYTIEILHQVSNLETALELEAKFIKDYGRIKNGGTLINCNDGGTSSKGEDNYFYKKKLSGSNNGNFGNKYNNNSLSKSIVCLDINGEFVKEYESISETELDGFIGSCVSNCCSGKRKVHRNKQFIYKSEYNYNKDYKYKRSTTSKRPVVSFKDTGNSLEFIKYYKSARDTEKDGFNSKNVSACCNGNKKSHGNLIWIPFDNLIKEQQDAINDYINDNTNKI